MMMTFRLKVSHVYRLPESFELVVPLRPGKSQDSIVVKLVLGPGNPIT